MTEEEINARLDEWLQPGAILKVDYGKKNPFNGRIHIRAIVDGTQIVYRYWSYKKRHWAYELNIRYWFFLLLHSNHLTKVYIPPCHTPTDDVSSNSTKT